jgi:hypothetical protein
VEKNINNFTLYFIGMQIILTLIIPAKFISACTAINVFYRNVNHQSRPHTNETGRARRAELYYIT